MGWPQSARCSQSPQFAFGKHDQRCTVASEVGRGTTFEVCFPVGTQEHASRAAARMETTCSLQGRRIYVVDDEPIITRGMHRLLADWGCLPSTANSLAEAERLFRECGIPDLLVTDLRLGENESGAAFAARMQRELGPFAVLVMTGETIPDALQEADRYGFVLLHKPIAAEKLREAMGELLSPQPGDSDRSRVRPCARVTRTDQDLPAISAKPRSTRN